MTAAALSADSIDGPSVSHLSVREWLQQYRKQLALLDRFLLELRLSKGTDRRLISHKTVELLRHIIGSTRWNTAAELLILLRGLGKELHAAGGDREPAIGNVVRRIMAAVREEAVREASEATETPTAGGRLSLQSMLWALPQHVKSKGSFQEQGSRHQRQESFASEADFQEDYPPSYYSTRPGIKPAVMEAIQEIMTDLEDMHRNINEQATSNIHADEIILTYGHSKTIELFLKAAAAKKRHFQVVVCEGAPQYGGHQLAKALAEAAIDTLVINDSAVFAMMARVNKVLLPAHAVLANGGLVTYSGCNVVALAAHHNSVPVVCVTGLFKLCPIFPHEGQDTLNDLVSPCSVLDYAEMCDPLLKDVELVNPVHDYVKPSYISLYITNVGSFQPSFIYRLLAEYYHTDDWETFE